MRASDGKTYKVERKGLSTQTIVDLALPPEERTAAASQTPAKTETTDATGVKQKNEQANTALQPENTVREQTRELVPGSTPSTTASPPSVEVTYRVAGLPKRTPYLNIREGPSADYPVVGAFAPGARGISLGPGRVTNGWTVWQQITGEGYSGWVNAQYLVAEIPGR